MQRLSERLVGAREHMEDVRDHMAFVMDGLRRGQLQWTPQLVPLLLRADGKVPKGFENFFPKGDKVDFCCVTGRTQCLVCVGVDGVRCRGPVSCSWAM